MPSNDNLTSRFKVVGELVRESNYTPSTLTEYIFFVAFTGWEDHEKATRLYLEWHAHVDLRRHPEDAVEVLNDWNCAKGLAVDYIQRTRFSKLDVKSANHVSLNAFPTTEPSEQSDTLRLWVSETEREIYTACNAGWTLWETCSRHGKISVSEAKDILRERFPADRFAWDDVLRAFRKNGGKHTDKYLRAI